jgi:hypothetical protein
MGSDNAVKTEAAPDVWLSVLADMEARRKLGIERYGKPVTPDAAEDWLQHLTEEIYDAAVYLKAHRIELAALRAKLAALIAACEPIANDEVPGWMGDWMVTYVSAGVRRSFAAAVQAAKEG